MTSLLRASAVGVFSALLTAGAAAQVLSQRSAPEAAPPPRPPVATAPDQPDQPDRPDLPDQPTQEDLEAQEPPPAEAPPGYIVSVESGAVLERAATTGEAITGMPLLIGDRLRSEGGRLEIKWADSSELRLARYTDLDLLSRSMVRVPRGRLTVHLVTPPGASAHDQLSIDAPGASVRFFSAGEYQVTVGGTGAPEVELAVIRGSAQIASDRGQLVLADGERSLVREGSAPSAPQTYVASAEQDEIEDAYDPSDDVATFQRGSEGAYAGTPYLPNELYGYETVLNSYGTWQSDPTYGHVWYPRVAADWRPYYRGRWHHLPRYGWTWVGFERWAYPTHHYGRWGFSSAGRWYWVPSRKWGAAWVSWAVAPNYVGWCPLGWDGRPVFGFANFGVTTVTVGRGYDPWRGWTVVHSNRFGRGYDVFRHRVDHHALVRERPAFVTTWSAPRRPGRGVVVERGRGGYGDTGAVPRHPGQRVRGSGPVPPSAGYSGYYPDGQGNRVNSAGMSGAVPRDESPYDRARRVMDRRGGRDNNPSNNDAPAGVTVPGPTGRTANGVYGGFNDRGSNQNQGSRGGYALPRYPYNGTARQPQRDDRRTSPQSNDNNDNDRDRGGVRAMPYRHAPGMSRPPQQDDAPGRSGARPRSSESDNRPTGGGWSRPDSDRGDSNRRGGNDDNGGSRGRSYDAGGSSRPSSGGSGGSGYATPRHGGGGGGGREASRGDGGGGGGRSSGGSRGGDNGGGRSGGGGGRGGNSGGGGAVPRHAR